MATVEISNPEKVYWPTEGYTKGDLIEYYRRAAPVMLRYLRGRPHSLHRHPDGIAGEDFYQKHVEGDVPPFVATKRLRAASSPRGEVRYLLCENEETLLYMANLGCIEIHPWLSHRGSLNKPDFLLLDLDPGDDTPPCDVVETARGIHELLEEICVPNFVKTSGKTGLHIGVPLGAKYTFPESRRLAEALARLTHQRLPNTTTIIRSVKSRGPGVYIDCLQNRRGQTMAAPYSVRPVAGATVSMPVAWSEVTKRLNPKRWTLKTTYEEMEERDRYWRGVLGAGIDLHAILNLTEHAISDSLHGLRISSKHGGNSG